MTGKFPMGKEAGKSLGNNSYILIHNFFHTLVGESVIYMQLIVWELSWFVLLISGKRIAV